MILNDLQCKAVRRRHCVGGGAPGNSGRRRRAAGPKESAAAATILFKDFRKKFVLFSKFKFSFFSL